MAKGLRCGPGTKRLRSSRRNKQRDLAKTSKINSIAYLKATLTGDMRMALQPADWSVVIIGRWNRAILTPSGIRKRLFQLEEATQVRVAVPLDGVSPYMVGHPTQQIIVLTEEGRLRIQVERADYETLEQAMVVGANALTALPETPVTAAGFNVNFRSKETTTKMASLLLSESEKALVNSMCEPLARTVGSSLKHDEGKLNVTLTGSEDGFGLSLNFHRGSERVDELKQWLQMPVENVKTTTRRVLAAFELDVEEVSDDADTE